MPLEPVREAVINAVVHTDYAQRGAPIRLSIFDNRLEIENPGLLPFGLTIEDLYATRFRVTIATTRVGPKVVEDTYQAILDALSGAKGLATSEIAAAISLSPRATRTRLARLVGRGLVREIGTGPQDPRAMFPGRARPRMSPTPEQKARQDIDAALEAAEWIVQDRATMNLAAGPGVAVREFKMASGHGFADYLPS